MKWLKTRSHNLCSTHSRIVALAIAVIGSSCATTQAPKAVKLPAYAGAFFSECNGKDGSVSIELYEGSKVQQIFDADWSSDSKGDFSLASYSPLGQTLFQLDYAAKEKKFRTTGKSFELLESLSISSDSIVELKGHEIGLKAHEITCLLNQKLPQGWQKMIVSESEDDKSIQYRVIDGDRAIRLALPRNGGKSSESWNVNIAWSVFWGFKKPSLSLKFLRNEQALVIRSNQFDSNEVRIIAQEE